MDSISNAKKRIRSARKRIVAFVRRKDLVTSDPLMAEIQMAQLDALLSIGHSLIDIGDRLGRQGQEPYRPQFPPRGYPGLSRDELGLNLRIDALQGELRKVISRLDKVPHSPWWKFW